MERETVLASFRGQLDWTEEARAWLRSEGEGTWFEDGDAFLQEFGGTWRQIFASTLSEQSQKYFTEIGLRGEFQPSVKIGDSYRGSFIMDAYLVVAVGIPAAYAVLKGASELSEIADGLENFKFRLTEEFRDRSNDAAIQRLSEAFNHANQRRLGGAPAGGLGRGQSLPRNLLAANITIDARPLMALHPEEPVSHHVHLSVSMTHDSVTLENLGSASLRNIRLGLFVNDAEQQSGSFADAFTAPVNTLGSHQSLCKGLTNFQSKSKGHFSAADDRDQFVDCWVQDDHGIYLFNFVLHP